MQTRSPRLLALCACLLLLAQVMPAAAVCRCDMPSGKSCCDAMSAVPAVHDCCAAHDADADGSYSGPPCHRDLVDAFALDAALPSGSTTVEPHLTAVVLLAEAAPASSAVAPHVVEGPRHDAPPGTSAPPVYLRHACLLL